MILPANRTIADLNTLTKIVLNVTYLSYAIIDWTYKIDKESFCDLPLLQVNVFGEVQRKRFHFPEERRLRVFVHYLERKSRSLQKVQLRIWIRRGHFFGLRQLLRKALQLENQVSALSPGGNINSDIAKTIVQQNWSGCQHRKGTHSEGH